MSIEDSAGASNGFSYGPVQIDTGMYPELRVKVSGTENARFYVDLMGADGQGFFGTGWQETPTETTVRTFKLSKGVFVGQVILYTWTEDGKRAENRFQEVALVGPQGKVTLNLESKPEPTSRARLDIRRAVATVDGNDRGIPPATLRAPADRNVILIDQGGKGNGKAPASPGSPSRQATSNTEQKEQADETHPRNPHGPAARAAGGAPCDRRRRVGT